MKALKFKTFLQGMCYTQFGPFKLLEVRESQEWWCKVNCLHQKKIIMENEREAQEKSSFKASNHGHTWGRVTKTFSNDISPASYSVCEWLVKTFGQGMQKESFDEHIYR